MSELLTVNGRIHHLFSLSPEVLAILHNTLFVPYCISIRAQHPSTYLVMGYLSGLLRHRVLECGASVTVGVDVGWHDGYEVLVGHEVWRGKETQ